MKKLVNQRKIAKTIIGASMLALLAVPNQVKAEVRINQELLQQSKNFIMQEVTRENVTLLADTSEVTVIEEWNISATENDNVTAVLYSDGEFVISGTGNMKDIIEFNDLYWREYRENIKTVQIEEGITNIGRGVFTGCSKLTEVSIPITVTSINDYAFFECFSLNSIELPEGLTNIGEEVFAFCSRLTSIDIPDKVVNIGNSSFYACDNLSSINANSDYYKSENGILFNKEKTILICYPENKTDIEEYRIPNTVEELKESAFKDCSLSNIEIPNSVKKIGEYAFCDCNRLKSIRIPEGVTNIGRCTLFDCSSLEEIILPSTLKTIGEWALKGCSNLTNINIPSEVVSIENNVFEGCSGLVNINIPSGVTNIGYGLFMDCSSLENINIPSGVTTIEANAFYGCSNLKKIDLPEGITTIDNCTFDYCSSLTEIKIPMGVTQIRKFSFEGCTNLNSIYIPEGVAIIEDSVFSKSENVVIYCKSGSRAEQYAKDKNIKYIVDDEKPIINNIHISIDPLTSELIMTVDAIDNISGLYNKPYSFDGGINWQEENSKIFNKGIDLAEIEIQVRDCLDNREIKKHEHTTVVEEIKQSTCTEQGKEKRSCSVCGYEEIEEIDALGHTIVIEEGKEPTCTQIGLTEGIWCSVCNEVLEKQEEIPAIGHEFGKNEEIIPPTCTSDGYTLHTCSRCESNYKDTYIMAIGHKYSQIWTIDKQPTHEEEGHKYAKCLNCEDKQEEIIDKLKENEVEVITTYELKEKAEATFISLPETLNTENMLNNIKSSQEVKLVNSEGVELKETDKVGTGTKIVTKDGEEELLTVMVKGDISGDGEVDFINDIVQLNNYRLNRIKLDDINAIAGDIDESEKVDFINDIVRMNNYRLGRINAL